MKFYTSFFFLILKCRPFPGIHKFLGSVVKHWLSTDCPVEFLKSKDLVVYFIITESSELESQRLNWVQGEEADPNTTWELKWQGYLTFLYLQEVNTDNPKQQIHSKVTKAQLRVWGENGEKELWYLYWLGSSGSPVQG